MRFNDNRWTRAVSDWVPRDIKATTGRPPTRWITVGKTCDASKTVKEEITTWWKDGAAKQETKTKVADNDKFSQMAYFETSAVACSYYPCSSTELSLVCLYNKDAADQAVTDLYTANPDQCQCQNCKSYLCPSKFTPAELSSTVCTGCDKSTQLYREAALYSHNYYRRLVVTGWAEDPKSKYAKPAKGMMKLKFEKTLEENAKNYLDVNANTCPLTRESADSIGENFWKSNNFTLSQEEAVDKAVEEWFSYLTDIGLGDDIKYANLKGDSGKMFGNVFHDETTKIICYVKTCAKQGVIVVDCCYDPKADGNIFETGKTCSSCGNAKCSPLGGLCA
ncbi:hypothetical protein RB195_015530 [Necator americanus]|uniref:SCP domain-containing protein n=1 Tax=Necator americanus TaxID=51031 RepID=A0ABR1E583_NECAM